LPRLRDRFAFHLVGAVVQVKPVDGRERIALDSLLVAQHFEELVNVREMVRGDVVNEGAGEFFAANVAIEPAQEKYELDDGREAECPPSGILEDDVHGVGRGEWRRNRNVAARYIQERSFDCVSRRFAQKKKRGRLRSG